MKLTLRAFNVNRSKRIILALSFLTLAIFSCCFNIATTRANEQSYETNTMKITQVVDEIINGIDLSELESIVNELDTIDLFNGGIKQKINNIINGKFFNDYSSVFSGIFSLLLFNVKEFLPFLFTIIAIGILANLINEFKTNSDGTSDIIHFVCMSVMVVTVIIIFKDVLALVSTTLNSLLKQMKILFPILIALMTAIGSFSSISLYNPLVAVLTNLVGIVFDKLLFPIFIIVFLFAILGNLTDTVKLNKFQGFLFSAFKWIVGIVFTLFTGFLSVQGITAGRFDSVSIKATKFAIKSYIPIVGSFISDGMDFLVLGSILVKNTIGLVGILIVFVSIISPVLSIVIIKLGLQLSSAVLEMSGSKKLSDFVSSVSKILIMPIVIIIAVSFMYLITIAIIMCTANIF